MGSVIDNTLGTNIFGSNSTDKALDAQTQGAGQATNILTQQYGAEQSYYTPYQQAGLAALSQLSSGNLVNGDTLANDAGYQFRLSEGNKAINNAAAARGLGNSGATMKALTSYGQNLASDEYNNAYNRQYNTLSQLAGLGNNAATSLGNAASSYGSNMANTYTGLGNAQASANIAQANQQANLLTQGMKSGSAMAAVFCDERLKENVSDVSKADLAELKANIKAVKWNYKDKTHGEGEWIGVMAQALEKSKLGRGVIQETPEGVKVINLRRAIPLLFAAIAEEAA